MKFTSKLGVVILIVYSAWLTGDKISQMGYSAGAQAGYQSGIQQGYQQGYNATCMVKPI